MLPMRACPVYVVSTFFTSKKYHCTLFTFRRILKHFPVVTPWPVRVSYCYKMLLLYHYTEYHAVYHYPNAEVSNLMTSLLCQRDLCSQDNLQIY